MVSSVKNPPPIAATLASLLLWGSFAWALPADTEAREGEAEAALEDLWAGVMISGAYDYAKCPRCGYKNEIQRPACYRCGSSLPQPSGEYTYPPWVFVPGKGFYRGGTLLEPAKKRTGLIITGYALVAVGVAAVIWGLAYAGETDGVSFYVGGPAGAAIGGVGGVLLIVGYITRKDPVYALSPWGLYENESNNMYARRSPDSDGPALKVEVTLLSF